MFYLKQQFKEVWSIENIRLRSYLDLQFYSIYRELSKFISGQVKPTSLKKKPMRVLDFGSGATSPWRKLLPKNTLYSSLDTHFAAQYKTLNEIPGQELFDVIICTEVLEHLESPSEVLKQIKTKLSKEGQLFLSVPFAARVHGAPSDFTRWTEAGLRQLFKQSGWQVESVTARGSDLVTVIYKLSYLLFRRLNNIYAWPWLIPLLGLQLSVLLPIAHLLLQFNIGFDDDPLGYIVIAKNLTNQEYS